MRKDDVEMTENLGTSRYLA